MLVPAGCISYLSLRGFSRQQVDSLSPQGMTVGVLQAVQLHDMAAQRLGKAAGSGTAAKRAALHGLPSAFHAKLPEVLDFPWNLATGSCIAARALEALRVCYIHLAFERLRVHRQSECSAASCSWVDSICTVYLEYVLIRDAAVYIAV
jgi:hypothetical protein